MEKITEKDIKPCGSDFIQKLSQETDIATLYELLDVVLFNWLEFNIKNGIYGDCFVGMIYDLKVLRDAFKEYQKPNI